MSGCAARNLSPFYAAGSACAPLSEAWRDPGESEALLKRLIQSPTYGYVTSIESKMDNMCTRMGTITYKLERQDGRIMKAEHRISAVKATGSAREEQLLNMDKILKLVSAKNEDLEARFCRNNL
ncbi:hypothetical protein NDU88_001643 [Pleurodeles waltl]|uniref:Uncharacterized protein n=1 Tax=Pleurodeles waltl TaxID=8319 RepID=A0AAV7RAY5_PLEWA|nr:hypothetical protein NDU88_001643 [Pleurodeles waltl]